MSESDHRAHTRAVWTALLVAALWSSSWVLIRVGLDDAALPPVTFAGLRYTLAAVVLAGWAVSRPQSRAEFARTGSSWWLLVLLGIVFYALTQGAQFVAIDAQPAATTSLMLAPTPLLVAVFAGRSIGERVLRRQAVGAALIVVGAAVYFSGDLGATVVGMLAATTALLANVVGALLGRSINRDRTRSPLVVTTISMSIGALILLASGLTIEGVPHLGWRAIMVISWLAVVNTAWAFTMWNASLRHLSALESSAINSTMLIQIAALAWIFLDEPPGVVGASGIVIVSIGIALAQGLSPRVVYRRRA